MDFGSRHCSTHTSAESKHGSKIEFTKRESVPNLSFYMRQIKCSYVGAFISKNFI